MELIPQPQELAWGEGTLAVGRLSVAALPGELAAYQEQIRRLLARVGRPPGPVVPVEVRQAAGPPESYRLQAGPDRVRIEAGDAHGALHAARTLLDLWDGADAGGGADAAVGAGGGLPVVTVADRPTFGVRGLFAESIFGTDRMELADWRELIDRLGQLKFNTLGVSVYGCWQLGHDRQPTEYLFLPLREFPQLRSPQRMVTWDPEQAEEVELTYLPRMFEADFFGEVVRYAAGQGIEVIPHLGGPGHSSLIPRLVPELSALDDAGERTGYGYCVTRPAAVARLAGLIRCLVEQHLRPAGVRRLHVAGDEFYPIRNVDPADLKRVVSPYCRCPGCRELSPGQLLVEYLVRVGTVLAESGLTMVHWQDTLVREGVREAYLDRVRAEGIPTPVIAWWKYNDPVPVPAVSGAPTWVVPTTGLFPHLFHQDFTVHIETVLRRGHAAGATGAFAYTLPNPGDHANVAGVADLSWNLAGSGGAGGFWRRWATLTCPEDPAGAAHAAAMARGITGSYPLMLYLVDHLLPYFATAAGGVTSYPDDLLRAFSIPQPGLAEVLRQVRDTLRDAVAVMPDGRAVRGWPDPTTTWRGQCERIAATVELFLDLLSAVRAPAGGPAAEGQAAALARQGRELLRLVADQTPPYLAPAVLREHWALVKSIEEVRERLAGDGQVAGAESWYAWII